MRETLTVAEIEQLTSFDHWRAIRADDNAELVRSLAKRGYLDKMYRGKQPRDPITGRFRGGVLIVYAVGAAGLRISPIPSPAVEPVAVSAIAAAGSLALAVRICAGTRGEFVWIGL